MLRRSNHASAKFSPARAAAGDSSDIAIWTSQSTFAPYAAFANPALYRLMEEEGYRYVIRLKANAVLEREIQHLLALPVGRPSHKPKVFYHSFQYQEKSWRQSRRVVAKVVWHAGELFPCVGFIVTNLNKHSKNVVKFYNGRGTAEQWIKEGKNAVKWTKLSCRTFKDNQTRLQLFALAYKLANFLRRLALPQGVEHWSLTTLRGKRSGRRAHIRLEAVPGCSYGYSACFVSLPEGLSHRRDAVLYGWAWDSCMGTGHFLLFFF